MENRENINQNITDKEVEQLLWEAARQLEGKEEARERKSQEFQFVDYGTGTGQTSQKAEKPKAPRVAPPTQRTQTPRVAPPTQRTQTSRVEPSTQRAQTSRVEPSTQRAQSDPVASQEPYVVKPVGNPYKEKLTVGRIIGTMLEAVWSLCKLAVFLVLVVGIGGFLLSRDMMLRGRNGIRQSTQSMVSSGEAQSNANQEKEKVEVWLSKVKREKLTMEADDGSILVARQIVENPDSNQWAVILHGYNGTMEDVYDIAMHYEEQGYNLLLPDLRASGESEGAFLGMGWLDRLDVINWLDVILKEYPSAQFVIHGVDIGADTALMMTGEPLKSNVKAVVAEGAYTNAWEAVKKEYKARHQGWPVFPVLYTINPVMKLWAGYTLPEADAVKQVKNASVPILYIQGGQDTYADAAMTQSLDTATASSHQVVTIAAGTHEDCRYAEPDTYYDAVFHFVGQYVQP